MKRNDFLESARRKTARRAAGVLALALTLGLAVAGCTSAPKELPAEPSVNPVALGPRLEESLRKYIAPQTQNWDGEEVTVYDLDPRRFEAFKAELEALGEYVPGNGGAYNRDWDQGKTFATWVVRPDGRLELTLAMADNSTFTFEYGKNPQASGEKLTELLGKYTAPKPETWGPDDARYDVYVYYLDPSRFEAFKAELSAGGEYSQIESWDEKRDWETGKTFARLIVMPSGYFELNLDKEDNSHLLYRYKKVFQAGEYDSPPKTITITGFTSQGITEVHGLGLFTQLRNPGGAWVPPYAVSGHEINGQTITNTLEKNGGEWWDRAPFTETGKFFIELQCAPPLKDPSKSGADYYYSADGINPTPVDIMDDATALEWSKFIWFEDWAAG